MPYSFATLMSAITFGYHTYRRRRAGGRARACSPPGILRGGAGAVPGAQGRLDLVQRLFDDTEHLVDFLMADRQRRAEHEAVADGADHQPLFDAPIAHHRPGIAFLAAETRVGALLRDDLDRADQRSEEHTSEIQSLMRT